MQKLESYINDICYGRASFNRLGKNPELQAGFRKGGPVYVGASLIAQRGGSTVSETSLSCDEVGYQSLIQEDSIEYWARHKGFWIDDISLRLGSLFGHPIAKGSEALVFKDENRVFKEWRFASMNLFNWRLIHSRKNPDETDPFIDIPDYDSLKAIYNGPDMNPRNKKILHNIAVLRGIDEYDVVVANCREYSLKIVEANME